MFVTADHGKVRGAQLVNAGKRRIFEIATEENHDKTENRKEVHAQRACLILVEIDVGNSYRRQSQKIEENAEARM
jgi:hypothetical protein